MKDKINQDLKKAMKQGDKLKVSVLRMLNSVIQNKEKEKQKDLTNQEIQEVIFSEIKKRKESIEQFKKGNRDDLVQKEQKELKILKSYIPDQLSKEEITKIAKEAIDEVGATQIKDMGKVMGKIMPKVKGKAEGSTVSKIVKNLLTSE